ncbi:hypothetical protein ANN_14848 [Periplaneta americana]|uniref:Reverse transcriptase domain-containing protein n=1 Tax=Periplaneta americana TaxID=6978 RepID=A0ABQ8SXF8_PERAM|nr:hypothetical protein ANN_14848 [Periplaneta americana]
MSSPTLFNIYLEDLVKNCFQNMGGVIVGGRRIKYITFADDMALLTEEEMILRDMLQQLNDSCEQYGMKINANKTKSMVIERKLKKVQRSAQITAKNTEKGSSRRERNKKADGICLRELHICREAAGASISGLRLDRGSRASSDRWRLGESWNRRGMSLWLRMQQIQPSELWTDAIDLKTLQRSITGRRCCSRGLRHTWMLWLN